MLSDINEHCLLIPVFILGGCLCVSLFICGSKIIYSMGFL